MSKWILFKRTSEFSFVLNKLLESLKEKVVSISIVNYTEEFDSFTELYENRIDRIEIQAILHISHYQYNQFEKVYKKFK